EFEQPDASGCDVVPGSLHPFEFEGTFAHADILDLLHIRTLLRIEGRPHRGQHNIDTVLLQRLGQIKGIGPHPANRVGGPQEPSDGRVMGGWHTACPYVSWRL